MNFLNPFALFGLIAAGIPVLLHLLNLRRLRTVEFSTLRFLQELQQTRVRRLKLQQILLLILRTLLIAFAVFAFARPSIPTSLPLLSSASRASVVILVDNSASMDGADAQGRRFRQAQDAATRIVNMLRDGDEVCVLPLAGRDALRDVGFTRTFAEASAEIERIAVSEGRADVPTTLRTVNALLDEAAHAHREVFVISDAQSSTLLRDPSDTARVVDVAASIFLVRIGNGIQGLEQNISIDSSHLITRLFQVDRPIEVEAFVRNGSDRDATGVLVSLAFDGNRVAQRAIDLPAGATRSVVLAAPPQRSGMIAASIELEDDAIDRDNVRYTGIMIPPPARCAVIGSGLGTELVATALALPGTGRESVRRFPTVAAAGSSMSALDVIVVSGGEWSSSDVTQASQFVERGGGLVVFASESPSLSTLLGSAGLMLQDVRSAPTDKPWSIRTIDETHPLFTGVFKTTRDRKVVESPRIKRLRPAEGGSVIAETDAGAFLSEGVIGNGRVVYVGVGLDGSWGPFGGTGLFAATMVRAAAYLTMPRDQGVDVVIGSSVTAPVPPRYAAEPAFLVQERKQGTNTVAPVRLPSSTVLNLPPQQHAGVLKVATRDSVPVMTVAVNAPTEESLLSYLSDNEWRSGVERLTMAPERVVVTEAGRRLQESINTARVGSELWPLFIVLAVLCAIAESLVARFMAQETTSAVSP